MKPIQSNINHYIFCSQFQFELDLPREMAFNLLAIDPNYWIKETAQNWVQNGTSSDVTVTFVGDDNKLNNFHCHKLIISAIVGKEYPLSLLTDTDNIIFADIEAATFQKFLGTIFVKKEKVEVKEEREFEINKNTIGKNKKNYKKKVKNDTASEDTKTIKKVKNNTAPKDKKPKKTVKNNTASEEKKEKKEVKNNTTSELNLINEEFIDCGALFEDNDKKSEIKLKRKKKKVSLNSGGVCSFCGYKTNHTGQLREHQRKHTGEKPEICSFCNKGFSGKKTLEAHKRIHTGERPYKCKFCNLSYPQRTSVNCHVRSQHKDKIINDNERVYEYVQCKKEEIKSS